MSRKTKDIQPNDKFNSWIVIEQSKTPTKTGEYKWICRCSCGLQKEVYASHLRLGASKQCRKCFNKNFPKGAIGSLYTHFKYSASKRKIEFKVSKKYLEQLFEKQNSKCALTGKNLIIYPKTDHKSRKETTASLDRINSSLGYIEGNLQWIFKPLNRLKGILNNKEFIQFCKDVVVFTQA